jgi:hypothetical protein
VKIHDERKDSQILMEQNASAATLIRTSNNHQVLKSKMGYIHFDLSVLGAGLVAHELFHAVMAYAELFPGELTGEDLAQAMQNATTSFWTQYWRNAIKPEWEAQKIVLKSEFHLDDLKFKEVKGDD